MRIRLAIAAAGLLLVPPADAAGAYSGHVRDPLGQPIAGATVRAGLIGSRTCSAPARNRRPPPTAATS